jgi:bifunctional DNA-binding transcriptional regulator/antitoxin component of YhaV-PrlF toxin-antitoxin module
MHVATLTNDEQLKVPKPVQGALGVRPGDQIGFEIRADGTVLLRAERAARVELLSLRGILKPKARGVTIEEMNDTIRQIAR